MKNVKINLSLKKKRLKSRVLILEQQIVNQSHGSVLQHQPVNLMDARLKVILNFLFKFNFFKHSINKGY
jgi:hypothetical protein